MKILLFSIAVMLMLVSAGALLVAREAEQTQAYVSNVIPESVQQRADDALGSAVDALRSLHDDGSAVEPSDEDDTLPDDTLPDDTGFDSPEHLAYEIAATGGDGVSARSDCTDDARIDGGFDEGSEVTIVSAGTGRCAGWTMVEEVATGTQSWVRDLYIASRAGDISESPTIAAAPSPPPSTPTVSTTPTPGATTTPHSTPTAAPTTAPPPTQTASQPPSWFGAVTGAPGDAVSASIGGIACGASTVYERDGEAFYFLTIPEYAPCSPSEGAAVHFTVNGASASASGVWRAGTATELPLP